LVFPKYLKNLKTRLIKSPLIGCGPSTVDFGEHRVKHTVLRTSVSADAPAGPDNDTLDISLPFSNILFHNINLNSKNQSEVQIITDTCRHNTRFFTVQHIIVQQENRTRKYVVYGYIIDMILDDIFSGSVPFIPTLSIYYTLSTVYECYRTSIQYIAGYFCLCVYLYMILYRYLYLVPSCVRPLAVWLYQEMCLNLLCICICTCISS
jgi:hypothetical protein